MLTQNRALFISHEGITSTIFTSQVVEHAISMKDINIDFDILTYNTFSKTYQLSITNYVKLKKNYPNINILLKKGFNIYYPFSTIINLLKLFLFLIFKRNCYQFIHARSDYTAFLCILLKVFHKTPVYWDCRGDSLDELRSALKKKNGFLYLIYGKLLIGRQKIILIINQIFADGAIFVSKELAKKNHALTFKRRYKIIPCPVPEKKFFFHETLRQITRQKYNISINQKVYIYSGSMVDYQGIEDHIHIYEKILNNNNIIIIATLDYDRALNLFKNLISDKFYIISSDYENINSLYNMADYAFMLREKKELNWVASPTKFGEYCLTGLVVILNDTIQQASENAKILGNYVHIDDVLASKPLKNPERKNISELAKKLYSRAELKHLYKEIYNLTN